MQFLAVAELRRDKGQIPGWPTPLTFPPATVQTEPKYEFKQALTFREQLGTFDVEYIGVRLNQMIDYIFVVA